MYARIGVRPEKSGGVIRILVTGGAGYIGSHAVVELLQHGNEVVVLDNLVNSSKKVIARLADLGGRAPSFERQDLRDRDGLRCVLQRGFDAVMHFAGLKAVGESTRIPLDYYENNVGGTLTLLQEMQRADIRTLVFSSSATVYGDPGEIPLTESAPTSSTNPYGRSKLMIEEMLRDVHASAGDWRISILRYFNPVGAYPTGEIGEDPRGRPNNLMPYVAQVAARQRSKLRVFGDDYPTRDGTGVRDYIHVMDLVRGHLRALEALRPGAGVMTHNLGTGYGTSVLELISAFEDASGQEIPYEVTERRAGDIAECWADPSRAERELGWRAEQDLSAMCRDAWRWQSRNPEGFGR